MCSGDFGGGFSCADGGLAAGGGGLMATGMADKSWFPSGRSWLNCGRDGVEVDGTAALWPRLKSASVARRMPKAGEIGGGGGGAGTVTFSGSRGNGLSG